MVVRLKSSKDSSNRHQDPATPAAAASGNDTPSTGIHRALQAIGVLMGCVFLALYANNREVTTSPYQQENSNLVQFKNVTNHAVASDSSADSIITGSTDTVAPPIPSNEANDGTTTTVETQAEENDPASLGPTRRTYAPRGRYTRTPLDVDGPEWHDTTEKARREGIRGSLEQEWGAWNGPSRGNRILEDSFYLKYPHRDVPRTEFPSDAWQLDANYLQDFLSESLQLVERAQKAIQAEYGKSTADLKGESLFPVYKCEDINNVTLKGTKEGGWTTTDSWQGLVKRILHAIMTEDVFVFAMGGHSASAGHGNHFTQSYTLQVQWILEAIFARMGVQHVARNFGNGGLGTAHNGLAAADIYGHDIDVLMWDSSMTEKGDNKAIETMHRQTILAGEYKVPVWWTWADQIAVDYYKAAKVPFGVPGNGMDVVEKAESLDALNAQPYAPRYMDCGNAVKDICKVNQYDGTCWIDRTDVTPRRSQSENPGGRASWHPGNRVHQLQGRVLAYTILEATKEALLLWKIAENFELQDEQWHMTADYNAVRSAVQSMDIVQTYCSDYGTKHGMEFVCKYPMKARTEFTPRAFPSLTNIRTLMPPDMKKEINEARPVLYNPPDIFNPLVHPPEGEVDVLSIVELGPSFESILSPNYAKTVYKKPTFSKPPQVTIGKGTALETKAGDDFCDGSVDSWCGRGTSDDCLLSGHNDGRHGLFFDGYSGWIVMNIPDLLHGHIVVKYQSWHQGGENWRTAGWIQENNSTKSESETRTKDDENGAERYLRHEEQPPFTHVLSNSTSSFEKGRRGLKNPPPERCDMFLFEYAINGRITSVDKTSFLEKNQQLQRVVETMVLLDDPEFTGGVETETEVAIRIVGCERHITFKLTHIYWA